MNNEPVDYPPLQAGGIIENNEPYGWHCFIGKGKEEQDFLFINGKGASKPDASWDKVIPLYLHLVKEQDESFDRTASHMAGEYVSYPVKELTDEDIAKVVHELNQKANTPERWVTAMQIGAETIIQLRDELAILRKAQE